MSLCDTCFSPGHCCKKLALNGGGIENHPRMTYTDALSFVRRHDLPFVPLQPEQHADGGWFWRFRCPMLGPTGRCTIYEDRPPLCRSFQAGSDDLCVHSRGTTAGDPSAGLMPRHWGLSDLLEDPEAPYPEENTHDDEPPPPRLDETRP